MNALSKYVAPIVLGLALQGGTAHAQEHGEHLNSVGLGVGIKGTPAEGESMMGLVLDGARELTHHLALKTAAAWHPIEEEGEKGSSFALAAGPVLEGHPRERLTLGITVRGGVEIESLGGHREVNPMAAVCAEIGGDFSQEVAVVMGLCGETTLAPRHGTLAGDMAVRYKF